MNLQEGFRKKTFDFHQFWNVTYIEHYQDGTHKTFLTIIKAKSCALAKKIIRQKIKEDIPSAKVKFMQVHMFHKNFNSKNFGKMNAEKWSNVRSAAFPNIANVLYKKHMENLDYLKEVRKKNLESQNASRDSDNPIGFKKGKKNWSHLHRWKESLPEDQRVGKVWNGGSWIEWDRNDMEKTKNLIINALIINNNVRMKAAKYLGIDRNALRMLMNRIPNFDWNKEYPPPKPFENVNREFSAEDRKALSERMKKVMKARKDKGIKPWSHLSEEQLEAARQKGRDSRSKKREASIKANIPKIKKALIENNNNKSKAARSLGKSEKWIYYWMKTTSNLVDWNKDYPSNK